MTTYLLQRYAIDAFKAKWPCHGLPDNLDGLAVTFDAAGDLVDLEAFCEDEHGAFDQALDTHDFDGPALLALVEDSKTLGEQLS